MGSIFRAAFQGLQRNAGVLLFYLAVSAATYTARMLLDTFYLQPRLEDLSVNATQLFFLVSDIVAVAIIAFAQTIAFSRMGRDIDRPMWRVADDKDALRLFYRLWLLLGLANVALARFVDVAASQTTQASAQLTLFFMWLVVAVLLVPFGASVMFYGRFARAELIEALSTMMHQLPRVLVLMFIGLFFGMLIINLQLELPVPARPILAIIDGYLDCFLFVCMWLICMYDRDDVSRPDDSDFDL